MQAVCEILPAGITSLALNLQTLTNFDKEETEIFSKTKDLTKCNYGKSSPGFIWESQTVLGDPALNKKISNFQNLYECDFPGFKIYKWLLNLKLIVSYFEYRHTSYSNILNKYNLRNKYFNTMIYEKAVSDVYPNVRIELEKLKVSGEIEFDKYFYGDLYEELTHVYINRYIDIIDDRLNELNKTQMPEFAPVRPFNKISQSMI